MAWPTYFPADKIEPRILLAGSPLTRGGIDAASILLTRAAGSLRNAAASPFPPYCTHPPTPVDQWLSYIVRSPEQSRTRLRDRWDRGGGHCRLARTFAVKPRSRRKIRMLRELPLSADGIGGTGINAAPPYHAR